MKVKVFPTKTPEQVVQLKLVSVGDGIVYVCAVDEEGVAVPQGNLCEFSDRGIVLFPYVNNSLGFPLDASKRIKLY